MPPLPHLPSHPTQAWQKATPQKQRLRTTLAKRQSLLPQYIICSHEKSTALKLPTECPTCNIGTEGMMANHQGEAEYAFESLLIQENFPQDCSLLDYDPGLFPVLPVCLLFPIVDAHLILRCVRIFQKILTFLKPHFCNFKKQPWSSMNESVQRVGWTVFPNGIFLPNSNYPYSPL